MDLLVIDEISMVRADLLDAVDATLRRYRNREELLRNALFFCQPCIERNDLYDN